MRCDITIQLSNDMKKVAIHYDLKNLQLSNVHVLIIRIKLLPVTNYTNQFSSQSPNVSRDTNYKFDLLNTTRPLIDFSKSLWFSALQSTQGKLGVFVEFSS